MFRVSKTTPGNTRLGDGVGPPKMVFFVAKPSNVRRGKDGMLETDFMNGV